MRLAFSSALDNVGSGNAKISLDEANQPLNLNSTS